MTNSCSWLTSSARLGSEGQLSEFIEGLGPGQLVGRQVLASPALGDIQLSMQDKRGHLEVEVIRARGLQCKPGSKTLPGKKSFNTNYLKHLMLTFNKKTRIFSNRSNTNYIQYFSTLGKSLFGERKALYGKGQDCNG